MNPNQSGNRSITVEIIQTVAEQTGRDPMDLPPLHNYIDPDALNSLFESTRTVERNSGEIEFAYDEYLITVSFDETRAIAVTKKPQPTVQKPAQSGSFDASPEQYSD